MYPFLDLGVPANDDPIPRLDEQNDKGKAAGVMSIVIIGSRK